MAQRDWLDVLHSGIDGDVPISDVIRSLFDRKSGRAEAGEGPLLDFKLTVSTNDPESAGEIARDILAFSNTEGGIIIGGVEDGGVIKGHTPVDVRELRQQLGPYLGTRVDYDCIETEVSISGHVLRLVVVVVPRSKAASPSLLRKVIQQGRLLRKVKYLPGSLFYRSGDQTLVEPPGDGADDRAQALGFSWAAPRTRSSFVLKHDRPMLRLYDSINDRVFGRDRELAEMRALFDDPRGRGVSIAGLGGIGKTEVAIRLVQTLYEGHKFQYIYSGSAKESVLGAGGAQRADPAFRDFPSFVRDLASWLGLQAGDVDEVRLAGDCTSELKRLGRVLLFVDNLETVADRKVTDFLDNELPETVWLVLTGRVHRVRTFLALRELQALAARPAAHLLRHEFKRQGLSNLADLPIDQLEQQAERLYQHPLALRWFAWACKVRPDTWTGRFELKLAEVESFCIAHTLTSLPATACRVLCALIAMKGIVEETDRYISAVAGVSGDDLDAALYELECAGLVTVARRDDGVARYLPSALSEGPAAELSRKNGWEREYMTNARALTKSATAIEAPSPILQDLISTSLWQIKGFTSDERKALVERIVRVLPRCPEGLRPKLLALRAECDRHEGNPVSADNLYRQAAEGCLASRDHRLDRDKPPILLEAATVALTRAHNRSQAERAVQYLEPIQDTDWSPARVLGTLAEASAIVGHLNASEYLRRAQAYLRDHEQYLTSGQVQQMQAALSRAAEHMAGRH